MSLEEDRIPGTAPDTTRPIYSIIIKVPYKLSVRTINRKEVEWKYKATITFSIFQ